jgi:hypothetical protein
VSGIQLSRGSIPNSYLVLEHCFLIVVCARLLGLLATIRWDGLLGWFRLLIEREKPHLGSLQRTSSSAHMLFLPYSIVCILVAQLLLSFFLCSCFDRDRDAPCSRIKTPSDEHACTLCRGTYKHD